MTFKGYHILTVIGSRPRGLGFHHLSTKTYNLPHEWLSCKQVAMLETHILLMWCKVIGTKCRFFYGKCIFLPTEQWTIENLTATTVRKDTENGPDDNFRRTNPSCNIVERVRPMFLIEKATSGKRSALLDTHQAQLGLLHDTTRKGSRLKTQQTAFGRLVAIWNVWWFRSAMGGFAGITNCETTKSKILFAKDDSYVALCLSCSSRGAAF